MDTGADGEGGGPMPGPGPAAGEPAAQEAASGGMVALGSVDATAPPASATGAATDIAAPAAAAPTVVYEVGQGPGLAYEWRADFGQPGSSNFLKGCQWAPDGYCLLSCADDNVLRLFNLPGGFYGQTNTEADARAVLEMREGETVYGYAWFPGMTSLDPGTCCFASSSRDHPVHLWDAFTGALRCSYRSYDHLDEITVAYAVEFSPQGTELYCGFKNCIRVFNTGRPGREFELRTHYGRKRGQKGIVSAIAFRPDGSGAYACGTYSKNLCLYDSGGRSRKSVSVDSGVTQLKFSPDGTKLYCGSRMCTAIQAFDVRNLREPWAAFPRLALTNQRMQFDLFNDGQYLATGDQSGSVLVYDTASPVVEGAARAPHLSFPASSDSVNAVSANPCMPLLATASGQRHFAAEMPAESDSSEGEMDGMDRDGQSQEQEQLQENSLKLWRCHGPSPEAATS